MFYELATQNPLLYCASVLLVMVSIILHELGHGAMAIRLGDDTPRLEGRMTFDPLVHMGVLSLVLLLLVGIAFGSMPVNHNKLRGRFAGTWVALAGPAVNFTLALVFGCACALVLTLGEASSNVTQNLAQIFFQGTYLNLFLGAFNLLPVPPLDGYAALAHGSLGFRRATSNEFLHRYGFLLLFVLMMNDSIGGRFSRFLQSLAFRLVETFTNLF